MRRPKLRRWRALAALLALIPGAAKAGPWIPKAQLDIESLGVGRDQEENPRYETELYFEAPMGARAAFTGKTRYETSALAVKDEVELGVKAALPAMAGLDTALQVSGTWADNSYFSCLGAGAEARVLVGADMGRAGFWAAEAAQRGGGGGGCARTRLDATLGTHTSSWLWLGQAFYEGGGHADDIFKVQGSVVKRLSAKRSLQVGIRLRLDGGGAVEPALILALWGSPGAVKPAD